MPLHKNVNNFFSANLQLVLLFHCFVYRWRGWRPLAADPHAPPGGQVSRDHVISKNPKSGVTFVSAHYCSIISLQNCTINVLSINLANYLASIVCTLVGHKQVAGGKWTTWREMAEDVIDKVIGAGHPKCNTLDIKLHGGEGYTESLSVQLIQKYGIEQTCAEHLVKTYGGRVWEVAELCKPTGKQWPRYGIPISQHYPYLEAEVRFACKEYACTIEDILSRRTRLAFLNKEAAQDALPRVADIMAEELGWNKKVKAKQIETAKSYLDAYGGRIPHDDDVAVRLLTHEDAMDIFKEIDTDGSGFLDQQEIKEMASRLGQPLSDDKLAALFRTMDKDKNGRIDMSEFVDWYNNDVESNFRATLSKEMGLGGKQYLDTKQSGGSFLG